jgi:hypothetical protein
MNNNSPVDQDFVKIIKSLEERVRSLETARQPYQGDWIELSPSAFTLLSTSSGTQTTYGHTILQTSIDYSEILTNGTKLKFYTLPSFVQYAYVREVTPTTIEVIGDLVTVPMSSVPANIAYSQLGSPTGFPHIFQSSSTTKNTKAVVTLNDAPGASLTISSAESFYAISGGFC